MVENNAEINILIPLISLVFRNIISIVDAPRSPTNGKIGETGLTSARFTWDAPTYKYKIEKYQIENAKWQIRPEPIQSTDDSQTSFLLSNLESGTEYHVKVRAVTEHNQTGDWSVSTTFVTGNFNSSIQSIIGSSNFHRNEV